MKRNMILLSAAALVMFAACQKEEVSTVAGGDLRLSAEFEAQGDPMTKTYLDGSEVKWSAEDAIKVYDDANPALAATLTATEGGSTSASFTGEAPAGFGTPTCAIYPASAATGIDGTTISFTLPATQNYVANSFDNGANVAVGTVSESDITFKNVCGVLKLQLKGNYKVSRIELRGKGNEKLNGSYSVDASTYTMSCVTTETDAEKVITLACPEEGVQLSATTATTFCFVVPAGAMESGFEAKVYSTRDDYFSTELSTTTDNKIKRSLVKSMPECLTLPPAYQKVASLTSTGTQFIETGLTEADYDEVIGATPVVEDGKVYLFKGNSETLGIVTFKKGGNIVHQFVPCALKFTDLCKAKTLKKAIYGLYDVCSSSNNLFYGVLLDCQTTNSTPYLAGNGSINLPYLVPDRSNFTIATTIEVKAGKKYSFIIPLNVYTKIDGQEESPKKFTGIVLALYGSYTTADVCSNKIAENFGSSETNFTYTAPYDGVLVISRWEYGKITAGTRRVEAGADMIQINEGSSVTEYQVPPFKRGIGTFTSGTKLTN